MNDWPLHHAFHGRLVMLGGGAIGQAVVPLLLLHIGMAPGQVTVIKATERDTGFLLSIVNGCAFRPAHTAVADVSPNRTGTQRAGECSS